MLVLFDIDGTLLLTHGSGIKAMKLAGQELFGSEFTVDGVEFSGRLDPLIWRDLAQRNSIRNSNQLHETFRAAYGKHLTQLLQSNGRAVALPGVANLIDDLAAVEHLTLGLLTGNYPETGKLKIQAAGLQVEAFRVQAWGCDAECRRDLTPLAIQQHLALTNLPIDPQRVIVIGDTPHDIDCAKAHGCTAIGVATGQFSAIELAECGADLALSSLADTQSVFSWIMDHALRDSEQAAGTP